VLPTLNRPAHNRPDRRQQFVDQSPIRFTVHVGNHTLENQRMLNADP